MEAPKVIFDARPLLAQGQDPGGAIQSAWAALPADSCLAVCAPFLPRPLIGLFSAQGIPVQIQSLYASEHWVFFGPKAC